MSCVLFPPSWLIMQSALGKRKRQSSKPEKSRSERHRELGEYIVSLGVRAMVSCTHCINAGVECYYVREESVSCAECLMKHRKCDGTFSLEELRKVGDQKKLEQKRRRQKLAEVAKLRKAMIDAQRALAEAEEEQHSIEETLAELDDRTERMLKREMQALGVLNSLPEQEEIALGDSSLSWLDHGFMVEQVNWEDVFSGGVGPSV